MSKNNSTSINLNNGSWTTSTNGGWITYYYTNGVGGGSSGNSIAFGGVDLAKETISKDGCCCKKCKEKNEYAEPNQDDGSFICYSCRIGW